MDSPIRKQQKRNDYLRHKLFRKINRRKKAEKEQVMNAPMKELRRRLRQKRTFKCGKDAYVEGKDDIRFVEVQQPLYDQYGNLLDPATGMIGTTALPNVEVIADPNDVARGRAKRQFTEFNDATTVADGRPQNQPLQQRTEEDAAKAAAWMKDHPILNNIGLAAGSVPFVVASAPMAIGGGELVGQALANPYVDALMTSGFGAHGLQSLMNGTANWETALEIAPLTRLVKPIVKTGANMLDRAFPMPDLRISPRRAGLNIPAQDTGLLDTTSEIENTTPDLLSIAQKNTAVRDFENRFVTPGFQIKMLHKGSPLEKQISKTGTVSTNNIMTLANKVSEMEKYVINKVLQERFPNLKSVNYLDFKKAVQDELIQYNKFRTDAWADYGLNRLGYTNWPIEASDYQYSLLARDQTFPENLQNSKWFQNRFQRVTQAEAEKQRNIPTTYDSNDYWAYYDNKINDWVDTKDVIATIANEHPELLPFKIDYPRIDAYTFENRKRILRGDNRHFEDRPGTLGHTRTFTTQDNPYTLHVAESQSDWAQQYYKTGEGTENFKSESAKREIIDDYDDEIDMTYSRIKEIDDKIKSLQERYMALPNDHERLFGVGKKYVSSAKKYEEQQYSLYDRIQELEQNRIEKASIPSDNPHKLHLVQNYESRQIIENMKIAAERGQTKMRYPTPDTAAKIEGYQKQRSSDEINAIQDELDILEHYRDGDIPEYPDIVEQMMSVVGNSSSEEVIARIEQLRNRKADLIMNGADYDYLKEHKTILKKYADFPKKFKKMFKGQDVRTITDKKGNTWYEVDVPKDFLKQEWVYGLGAAVAAGATTLKQPKKETPHYASGKDSGIHINPKNRGKFNALKKRTGKTTEQLTHSKNPLTRKRAIFAQNSKKFKH